MIKKSSLVRALILGKGGPCRGLYMYVWRPCGFETARSQLDLCYRCGSGSARDRFEISRVIRGGVCHRRERSDTR